MPRPETVQNEGIPSDWTPLSHLCWKWLDDVRKLLQGVEGRQNFINTITNSKPNNFGVRTFFTNKTNGDAEFYDYGQNFPYIGTGDELIVPGTIVATRRSIVNVGAVRVYQSAAQGIPNNVDTIMTFDAKEFDEDTAFDLATETWTPKQAGKYSVTAQIAYPAGAVVSGKSIFIYLAKNGVNVAASQVQSGNTDNLSVSVTSLLNMNGTTDHLQVIVNQNFGAFTITIGLNFACYLTAFKVD